jgi:hypothetical protein
LNKNNFAEYFLFKKIKIKVPGAGFFSSSSSESEESSEEDSAFFAGAALATGAANAKSLYLKFFHFE